MIPVLSIFIIILLLTIIFLYSTGEKRTSLEKIPSERTLQAALESIGDPVLLFDTKLKIVWNNMAADRVFGSMLGLECMEKFHNEGTSEQECSVSAAFMEGKILSHVRNVHVKSDEERLFLISTAPVRDDEGEIRAVVKSFRDLSQIIQLEEAAAKSTLKYMQLFENLMDGFAYHKVVTDENSRPVDYIYLEVNHAFEQLTGLQREDLIGRKVTEVMPDIQESGFDWIGKFGMVALTGEPVRIERYFETLQKWYIVNCYCPGPGTFAVIYEEITERKGGELMVRASLEQKEILIREIHHRVNSNLRSISQILNVQASFIPEEWDWTSKILKDTQLRIMAMGLIHQTMYGMNDLSRIPLGAYTRTLVDKLTESIWQTGNFIEVSIEIPDDLTLNVETATVCGLIITELVSNSLKHAFGHASAGHITVSCREGEDSGYILEERDNGTGIPHHVDLLEPETLGFKLLNSYIEMIAGKMTFSGDAGTAITVSFMENEETDSVIY